MQLFLGLCKMLHTNSVAKTYNFWFIILFEKSPPPLQEEIGLNYCPARSCISCGRHPCNVSDVMAQNVIRVTVSANIEHEGYTDFQCSFNGEIVFPLGRYWLLLV